MKKLGGICVTPLVMVLEEISRMMAQMLLTQFIWQLAVE